MYNKIKKIERVLEIPQGIIDDTPVVKCYGTEKVIVSNYVGIKEYEEYIVRLNTKQGMICIYGISLKVSELTVDDIMILGSINSIEFER